MNGEDPIPTPRHEWGGPTPTSRSVGANGGENGLLWVQFDRCAVDAVAQPGRLRPVVEHVPQVPAAARAVDLGTDHEVRAVHQLLDGRALRRRAEARPAAERV